MNCKHALGAVYNLGLPPPQGEARSGRVPTQNASAFCVGTRGRIGEGVSDIMDEPKFQFFNCLLPSSQPLSRYASKYLSQRDWNSSRSDKHCLRSKREGLIRRIVNSP